jgi:hypothetical protein
VGNPERPLRLTLWNDVCNSMVGSVDLTLLQFVLQCSSTKTEGLHNDQRYTLLIAVVLNLACIFLQGTKIDKCRVLEVEKARLESTVSLT